MIAIKRQYLDNKAADVGTNCTCPSCRTDFVKKFKQQAFCGTKPGTECKDKYWNTVTPKKRNNTTRISPASQRFIDERQHNRWMSGVDEGPEGWDGHKDY